MRLTRAIMSGCAEQDAAPRLQASRWGRKARETGMLVYLLIVHPRGAQYRRARKSKFLSVSVTKYPHTVSHNLAQNWGAWRGLGPAHLHSDTNA